jgi:HK97 family phage portal protein
VVAALVLVAGLMSLIFKRPPTMVERSGLVDMFESWQGARPKEKIEDDFRSYVSSGYKGNSVVFATILARMSLFSEVELAWRNKATKAIFTNHALDLLQNPWVDGRLGDLLNRMEQHASLGGNSYTYKASPTELQQWRPDRVTIVSDRYGVAGYLYEPDGPGSKNAKFALAEEVAHWAPIPDPYANFRGMSWLTPILMEIQSDVAMTRHKQMFFERAATPNLLIKVDKKLDPESRARMRDELQARHEGLDNAYRSMLLEDGADATVIGSNMQAINFDVIQAAGENRIATAGGVPGIVVGLKEGLQAATYSNYQQAMRRFADLWARPQWRSAVATLEHLLTVPAGCELWYDSKGIAALGDSNADAAKIMLDKSTAIVNLVRAGYEGAAVAKVVETGEGLGSLPHTGEVYYPGAQAYTQPGETPAGVPGDETPNKTKATPALPAPAPNGAKKPPVNVGNG